MNKSILFLLPENVINSYYYVSLINGLRFLGFECILSYPYFKLDVLNLIKQKSVTAIFTDMLSLRRIPKEFVNDNNIFLAIEASTDTRAIKQIDMLDDFKNKVVFTDINEDLFSVFLNEYSSVLSLPISCNIFAKNNIKFQNAIYDIFCDYENKEEHKFNLFVKSLTNMKPCKGRPHAFKFMCSNNQFFNVDNNRQPFEEMCSMSVACVNYYPNDVAVNKIRINEKSFLLAFSPCIEITNNELAKDFLGNTVMNFNTNKEFFDRVNYVCTNYTLFDRLLSMRDRLDRIFQYHTPFSRLVKVLPKNVLSHDDCLQAKDNILKQFISSFDNQFEGMLK